MKQIIQFFSPKPKPKVHASEDIEANIHLNYENQCCRLSRLRLIPASPKRLNACASFVQINVLLRLNWSDAMTFNLKHLATSEMNFCGISHSV